MKGFRGFTICSVLLTTHHQAHILEIPINSLIQMGQILTLSWSKKSFKYRPSPIPIKHSECLIFYIYSHTLNFSKTCQRSAPGLLSLSSMLTFLFFMQQMHTSPSTSTKDDTRLQLAQFSLVELIALFSVMIALAHNFSRMFTSSLWASACTAYSCDLNICWEDTLDI